MGNRPSPGPVFQRPVRQPGSAPYKPPLIPIRHGPPKIPNRYTPQQTAPSSNQATYVNPGLQGKNIFDHLFTFNRKAIVIRRYNKGYVALI